MAVQFGVGLTLALASFALALLVQPKTPVVLQAAQALGPLGGWRCAQSPTYVYDPRRERADPTLMAEPPETALRAARPALEVEVERVEANLRGGDTVLWTRATNDGHERRVYVLAPGHLEAVGNDRVPICQAHLGGWGIVGEHGLE